MIDDLCGQKIGKLSIIERVQKYKNKGCSYLCKCDCGSELMVNKSAIVNKQIASCGCSRFTDISGKIFNNWKVLERVPKNPELDKQEIKWKCKCKCGKISEVLGKCLKNGTSKSCGCLVDEIGLDLSGKTFGFLQVLNKASEKILPYSGAKWKRKGWNCICVCGRNKILTENSLLSGNYTSCGCMHIAVNLERNAIANEKSRKFTPNLASAKNVYRGRYDDGNIIFEKFIELSQQECIYCGAQPSNCANRFRNDKFSSSKSKLIGSFIYNGLDRIDSSKLHTLDNVVPCCKTCNYAKRQMSVVEFYNWIEKVHNKSKEINMHYDYECSSCKHTYELEQSIKDDANTECPKCKKQTAKRLITGAPAFVLKGSGWASEGYSKK
jgi:putative FmdB family regulatory protein